MAIINKDEELKLEQQLEEKTKELEALMAEQSNIEKVTLELQADLVEMSKHQVYQKYAYLTMQEIRDVMFQTTCKDEMELKDDNCAQLDIQDVINLQQESCQELEEPEKKDSS